MDNIKQKSYWRNINFFDSFFIHQVLNNRRKFLKIFKNKLSYGKSSKILDVGTTPSLDPHENFLVRKYPFKNNITCLSNFSCEILKKKYPEINLLIGDARCIDLDDNSFEIVHSNATIEHVGSYENQLLFIKECYRVSKKYIFITTPNRYFPIDFHTKIPLLNILPKTFFRYVLKLCGDKFFSKEENLNLMCKNEIIKIVNNLKIKNYTIYENKIFGLTANFLLIIEK